MTLAACARIVREGDPDRFLCAMAAPPAARAVLFPLYAFNLEIARAPWASREPLIALMRLQWWEDALDEIAGGGPVRRHEVASPLAEALPPGAAAPLRRCIAARRREVDAAPFADAAELWAFLEDSAGGLALAGATALGAGDAGHVVRRGSAAGLAAWLRAVPRLAALGRQPLPVPAGGLAEEGLVRLGLPRLRGPAAAAQYPERLAPGVLRRAARDPSRVARGGLEPSAFARRLALLPALFGA